MLTQLLHEAVGSLRDRRGVTATEYAILAIGIVIVVGVAVLTLADPTTGAFARVGSALTSKIAALPAEAAGSR